jgi:hypothetical protein
MLKQQGSQFGHMGVGDEAQRGVGGQRGKEWDEEGADGPKGVQMAGGTGAVGAVSADWGGQALRMGVGGEEGARGKGLS